MWPGRFGRDANAAPEWEKTSKFHALFTGGTQRKRYNSRTMLANYLPILIFLCIGAIMGTVLITAGWFLGPRRPNPEKDSPYECGFEAFEDARMQFDVRYYLIAILFIIFDLEIAFFFPWAVALREIGMAGFWAMMIFLLVLVVGFIYEWRKGALEWE